VYFSVISYAIIEILRLFVYDYTHRLLGWDELAAGCSMGYLQ
jgi:hypothetical protein